MSDADRERNDLSDFPGVALSLAECALVLSPHQTAIVSLAVTSYEDLRDALDACRGFVVVPNSTASPSWHAPDCLARVVARSLEETRVVLAVRGLCRAETTQRYGLPAGRELLAVRLLADRLVETPTIHRDNRRRELLEAASELIPGPVPMVVTSYLLDRVPLGSLCDLVAEVARDPDESLHDLDVDSRSDAVLMALRHRSRELRGKVETRGSLPGFSEN